MSTNWDFSSPYLSISPEALAPASLPGSFLLESPLLAPLLPPRPQASHKGSFGRVGLWAGSRQYPGALLLAAEAALRSGVGYVEIASDAEAQDLALLKFPELVLLQGPREEALDLDPQLKALAAGPGWSLQEGRAQILRNLWASDLPLILDADALNLLAHKASGPDLRRILKQRQPGSTLLTPHPGEFARLAPDLARGLAQAEKDEREQSAKGPGLTSARDQAEAGEKERLLAARQFAQESGALLLLKGSQSILALPDGLCFVSRSSCSGLARAGSGDVLTGLCLGLAGQGPSLAEAALLAIWLHVKTAQLLAAATSERSMRVGDLPANFYRAFRCLEQEG